MFGLFEGAEVVALGGGRESGERYPVWEQGCPAGSAMLPAQQGSPVLEQGAATCSQTAPLRPSHADLLTYCTLRNCRLSGMLSGVQD